MRLDRAFSRVEAVLGHQNTVVASNCFWLLTPLLKFFGVKKT